jgi:hypothetical protein
MFCLLNYCGGLLIKSNIEILASVGSFFSAIVAMITLFEIKKQRHSMYKPEIFLTPLCFKPEYNPIIENEKIRSYTLLEYNNYQEDKLELKSQINILYKLENLGFGVASNVLCQWNFDYSKAIKEMEKILPEDFTLSDQFDYTFINRKSNPNFLIAANVEDIKNNQKIDFIPPINFKEHHNLHSIPHSIIIIYLMYLLFNKNLISDTGKMFYIEEFEALPKPKVIIEYKDLNGKKYSKTYTLSISACSLQSDQDVLDLTKEYCIFYCLPIN